MTTIQHPIQVVVAYDFSPSAEEALIRAIDVAARAPQHVLHVIAAIDPHDRATAGPLGGVTYETADRIQKMILERVTSAFAGRQTASEVRFFVHARIGKPAPEILQLASEVGADLIFIGSHGNVGIERLLLGSVSERVVREAGCPVMVARPKTYEHVDLLKVSRYDHERSPHHDPHTYGDQHGTSRPLYWSVG